MAQSKIRIVITPEDTLIDPMTFVITVPKQQDFQTFLDSMRSDLRLDANATPYDIMNGWVNDFMVTSFRQATMTDKRKKVAAAEAAVVVVPLEFNVANA
jgi:hypothetical protein